MQIIDGAVSVHSFKDLQVVKPLPTISNKSGDSTADHQEPPVESTLPHLGGLEVPILECQRPRDAISDLL